jgi:hypothetical protein
MAASSVFKGLKNAVFCPMGRKKFTCFGAAGAPGIGGPARRRAENAMLRP